MEESILKDVKKQIGIAYSNHDFDPDVLMAINTVLFDLHQMGIVNDTFAVDDERKTWDAILLKEDQINLYALKTWVALKVKMIFDPPTSSVLAQAIRDNIDELTWRIYITENYVGEI